MGIRTSLSSAGKSVVEELERAVQDPEARSVDNHPSAMDSNYTSTTRRGKADKHFPNKKKLRRYWEIYQEVPIIRNPISTFASEVISPGYYVDTENKEAKEKLEEWLSYSSIVSGQIDADFSTLLKKAQVQREVKGTSLVEKVKNDEGDLYGFKLMRPETVRAYTKPGQTVLLPPDYDIEGQKESASGLMRNLLDNQQFYKKSTGEIAAYVQLDDPIADKSQGAYIPFTRDEVIKLTRCTDAGEIFGESRITSVEDRLNSLLNKLDDLDKAIESMSSPFQLFKFGSEENPWSPEEIEGFMKQHRQEEFEPGMKQGVQGDLSVDTVDGQVPPIEEYLQWDLNYIMSEMPMPKYALGGFTSDVNQFVSRSQSARLENQKDEARIEIENEWTPVIKEKAEELGYDKEEINGLVIGQDPEELGLEQQIPEDDVNGSENVGEDGTNFKRPPASTEPNRDGGGDVVNDS